MASAPETKDYPYTDSHVETWATFCAISKWVAIGCIVGLVLMAAFLTGDHGRVGG
jgi:hypothetical protein